MSDKPERPGVNRLAHDALHDLIHFDTKLFRTIPALLFKPGKVTEKTLAGEPDYVKPFALFVFLNFVFFIFKSKGIFQYPLDSYQGLFGDEIQKKLTELHIAMAVLTERFNMAMRFEQKEFLVIMVPLFALIMQLLYLRQRRGFATHLVFSLNFYSFFIIFLIVAPTLLWPVEWLLEHLNTGINLFYSETALVAIILGVCFVYLFFALARVYREAALLSIFKSLVLSFSAILIMSMVYRTLLFYIVMHTVGE